ncbi:S9 family peptidase [Acidovorax sp. sic0104]|uniref:S9 family peptidase n=1 Tax=Acidovorax sp. sic0104 TaxID=2854784 RepID=UPI001C47A3F7|nr:S9 family peptidase [Acidovorax sp. sic0104]MBV7543242.1 S9 family peptidase [Acidovorax sp. sic0104]
MQMKRFCTWAGLAVCALWLAGCASGPAHPALVGGHLPDLVPVRDFVASRQSTGGYRVSPDGQRIAWFGVDGVVPAIWVQPIDGGSAKAFRIRARSIRFSADSRWLGITADLRGDENTRIFAGEVEGPGTDLRELMPAPRSVAHFVDAVEGTGDFTVTSNQRDKKVFDLYRVSAAGGAPVLLATNPGNVNWWGVDPSGQLRARTQLRGDEALLERPGTEAGSWVTVAQRSRWDTLSIFGLHDEGRKAWALSNRGRDKLALVRLDMITGAEDELFASPDVDLDSVTLSRRTREPLVANFMPGYPARQVFDPALAARLSALAGEQPAEVFVTSMDRTDTVLAVSVSTDRGTRSYLLREGQEPRLLGENRLSLIAKDLAPTRPITYVARDGLTVHGYLTLPQGVVPQRLPMVLLVHGGPWARDRWGDGATSRAMQQFLANRGYAVLQVNYRGSSGYGRAHMERAMGEFAGRMHDDLVDGVRWAVEQGVADTKRVAIYGASYGGYSALVGATFTPEVFACAVDVVGVTDIARLLESAPPYWELGLPWWHRYVGNPAVTADRARMDAKSPLYHAEHAQKPILIMHGVNDPRVKLEQSEWMVAALRKAGKEVDYVTFTGDGHGNQKWSNNLTMYRKTEDFLAQCLGGRTSGFDYYQLGAWAF